MIVLDILNMDLVKYLLKIFRLDTLHVHFKLVFLLWLELHLKLGIAELLEIFDIGHVRSSIMLQKLDNLKFLFTLKMLIDSSLHGFNSLTKSGVPVVLNSIISAAHEFLGNEAPFLVLLVP